MEKKKSLDPSKVLVRSFGDFQHVNSNNGNSETVLHLVAANWQSDICFLMM